MAELAGGRSPEAMEDDGAGDAQRRGGAQLEGAFPGAGGGSSSPRGVADSSEGSARGTDRSAGEIAATTSSAGVFPAKFSSFPGLTAPAPALRPVSSLFPSSGNVSSLFFRFVVLCDGLCRCVWFRSCSRHSRSSELVEIDWKCWLNDWCG